MGKGRVRDSEPVVSEGILKACNSAVKFILFRDVLLALKMVRLIVYVSAASRITPYNSSFH